MKNILIILLLAFTAARAWADGAPYAPANQAEVNAGLNAWKAVTPKTLAGFAVLSSPTSGITANTASNISAAAIANYNTTNTTSMAGTNWSFINNGSTIILSNQQSHATADLPLAVSSAAWLATNAVTNLNYAATIYVATNGNDSTALIGRPDRPCLTLSNAFALAGTNGGVVQLGVGTFKQPMWIAPPANLTLRGMGDKSVLSFTNTGSAITNRTGIVLTNDNVTLRDFQISVLPPTGASGGWNNTFPLIPQGGVNNLIERVTIVGDSDGVYTAGAWANLANSQFTFRNCDIVSGWDGVLVNAASASSFVFDSCRVSITEDPYLGDVDTRGITAQGSGTVQILNCTIYVNNLEARTGAAYALLLNGAANSVTLQNNFLTTIVGDGGGADINFGTAVPVTVRGGLTASTVGNPNLTYVPIYFGSVIASNVTATTFTGGAGGLTGVPTPNLTPTALPIGITVDYRQVTNAPWNTLYTTNNSFTTNFTIPAYQTNWTVTLPAALTNYIVTPDLLLTTTAGAHHSATLGAELNTRFVLAKNSNYTCPAFVVQGGPQTYTVSMSGDSIWFLDATGQSYTFTPAYVADTWTLQARFTAVIHK